MSYDEDEDFYEEEYEDEDTCKRGRVTGADLILTTGITVASLAAGLAALNEFVLRKDYQGYDYALLMEQDDGSYKLVHRIGMPCWGALREYECGTRPNDTWPEDLMDDIHIFPKEGKPVAVAACFHRNSTAQGNKWYTSHSQWNTFIEFVFNKDISPWRKALKDVELVKNEDGVYWGCVFKDTNIDPNIMVNLLRCNAKADMLAKNFAQTLADNPGIDPRIAYLASKGLDSYNMAGRIVPERWWNGEPADISSGLTFYERESYNRPDNEYLFGGKNNEGVVYTTGWGNVPSISSIKNIFADQLALVAVEA